MIRAHLTSVWALELLLVLRREPERDWTVPDLTRELRATEPLVATALLGLERSGLVADQAGGAYRYAPASDLLAQFGEAVDLQYRERPVTVINLIAAPEDRIQKLADAFRFRGHRR